MIRYLKKHKLHLCRKEQSTGGKGLKDPVSKDNRSILYVILRERDVSGTTLYSRFITQTTCDRSYTKDVSMSRRKTVRRQHRKQCSLYHYQTLVRHTCSYSPCLALLYEKPFCNLTAHASTSIASPVRPNPNAQPVRHDSQWAQSPPASLTASSYPLSRSPANNVCTAGSFRSMRTPSLSG